MLSQHIISLDFRTVLSRMLARGVLISIALAVTTPVAAQTAPAAPPNQAAQGAPAAPPGPQGPAPQAPPAAAQAAQPAPNGAYPAQPPPAGYQPAPSPLYQQQPTPLYQPPPAQPYGGWRPARPSRGLMITGISILGASYLIAMSIGLELLDEDDCRQCNNVAPWLFVPVVGPFIGMSQTDDADWALWFLGMVEVVGTGLMIGGIVRYTRTKRAAEMQSFSSWELPGGRTLSLDAATSARMVGPRLKLTF